MPNRIGGKCADQVEASASTAFESPYGIFMHEPESAAEQRFVHEFMHAHGLDSKKWWSEHRLQKHVARTVGRIMEERNFAYNDNPAKEAALERMTVVAASMRKFVIEGHRRLPVELSPFRRVTREATREADEADLLLSASATMKTHVPQLRMMIADETVAIAMYDVLQVDRPVTSAELKLTYLDRLSVRQLTGLQQLLRRASSSDVNVLHGFAVSVPREDGTYVLRAVESATIAPGTNKITVVILTLRGHHHATVTDDELGSAWNAADGQDLLALSNVPTMYGTAYRRLRLCASSIPLLQAERMMARRAAAPADVARMYDGAPEQLRANAVLHLYKPATSKDVEPLVSLAKVVQRDLQCSSSMPPPSSAKAD